MTHEFGTGRPTVLIVFGTRPEAIKLAPLIVRLSVGLALVSLLIETRIMGRRWGVSAPVSSPDVAR